MKRTNNIELKLDGRKITVEKFRRSISAFYNLIDEVAFQVSGKRKQIQWIVTVEPGSIVLANKPEVDKLPITILDKTVDSFDNGIATLEKKAVRPDFFSDAALEYVQYLASIPEYHRNGLEHIGITINQKSHILTHRSVANVEEILSVYGKALGSIEGRLSTISERGGLKIVVYEQITDKAIRCHIEDEMLDNVTSAFGKRVYIYGLINYGKDKLPKSIQVEEIRVFPSKDAIPSAMDVYGILSA